MIYAFDCDETLEVSGGPVLIEHLVALKDDGHILGVCGNWAVVVARVIAWEHLFSFIGPIGSRKATFLQHIKRYIPSDDHVLVGNDHSVGAFVSPNDAEHAREASWRFINETAFAAGAR